MGILGEYGPMPGDVVKQMNREEEYFRLKGENRELKSENEQLKQDSDSLAEDLGREIERGDALFDIAYAALNGQDKITAWTMGFE